MLCKKIIMIMVSGDEITEEICTRKKNCDKSINAYEIHATKIDYCKRKKKSMAANDLENYVVVDIIILYKTR